MMLGICQSGAFHAHHQSNVVALVFGFFAAISVFGGVAKAQNPVPLISQPLVPDAVKPGGAGFGLTISGTGFAPGTVVLL